MGKSKTNWKKYRKESMETREKAMRKAGLKPEKYTYKEKMSIKMKDIKNGTFTKENYPSLFNKNRRKNKEKQDAHYQQMRKEVSAMAKIANKNLRDLEKEGLERTPAYRTWKGAGSKRFGLQGKNTYFSVQKEWHRVRNFLDAKTSTPEGAWDFLEDMAINIGLQYEDREQLKKHSDSFMRIATKISEYYEKIGEDAKALNYNRIWTQINVQIQNGKFSFGDNFLTDSEVDAFVDNFIENMDEIIKHQEPERPHIEGDDDFIMF